MPALPILFFLFTAIPLVELWLLFRLSGIFGFWTTIGLVLGTGLAGAMLARWQGWRAVVRVRSQMRQGILPAGAIGDGLLILGAGLLLVTPGVLTDILGLALLVPPLRSLILAGIRRWLARHARIEAAREGTTLRWESSVWSHGPGPDRVVDARVIRSETETGPEE